MKRPLLLLIIVLALSGCAPQGKTGEIALDSPPDGAIIYSSALTVSGTAKGVNGAGFIVTVTDSAGNVLTRKDAPDRDSPFNYELIHGYSGEPTAVTVTLTAADAPADPPYATVNVTLASLEHRPEGSYVDILTPQMGDEIGGDLIAIEGRASGLTERTFTVELVGSDGALIDSAEVTLPPSYVADDLPWKADLNPDGTTGSAIVRVVSPGGEQLNLIAVILSAAAG